jgi:predicted deacylase
MASPFSQTYAEARQQFLVAAQSAGFIVHSHLHPKKGRDGEQLATDVVRIGAADASKLTILSSGCHGVEGFCGSGVQVALLRDAEKLQAISDSGTAVLIVHALNPHGFSHWRRVTEDNVDLNRNFHPFEQALPVNDGYAELHPVLLPEVWPPIDHDAAAQAYIAKHSQQTLQAVATRGQHSHPDGVFFGGTKPTWSNNTIRKIVRQHTHGLSHLAWVDVHTGLGPSGHGERILATRNEASAIELATRFWNPEGKTPITSFYDGSSSSAYLTGLLFAAAYDEAPKALYTGIALEFGTQPMMAVMQALRADHWLAKHPEAPAEQAAAIKQQIRDAFYVNTPAWKKQIVAQGLSCVMQAVQGLSSL